MKKIKFESDEKKLNQNCMKKTANLNYMKNIKFELHEKNQI